MNMHKLLCGMLTLYGAYIISSSPRELALIETSSKIESINHKRSSSTSELYSRLSCYPTPKDLGYSNYQDIDSILVQHNPSASSFFQNGNGSDIQNQYSNPNMNSYYAVNISNERPKTAKFSKKTVIAFTFLGCLNVFKIVVDVLEIEKYYSSSHASNDGPENLYASLGMDITSLLLVVASYQCNHNKF